MNLVNWVSGPVTGPILTGPGATPVDIYRGLCVGRHSTGPVIKFHRGCYKISTGRLGTGQNLWENGAWKFTTGSWLNFHSGKDWVMPHFNRKFGPNINFEIFWNFYFNFHKNFKIDDIGSTFSVRKLENDMKLNKKSQIQNSFFFLKM